MVADEVALCSDNDLCTSEKCVADPKTGLGTCQYNVSKVNCSAEPPECFGPQVCGESLSNVHITRFAQSALQIHSLASVARLLRCRTCHARPRSRRT